jgi:glucose-6-phosphate isomerase
MPDRIAKKYPEALKVLLPTIKQQIEALKENRFLERFNQRDVTLWSEDKEEQDEIAHRMAWLEAAEDSAAILLAAQSLLQEVTTEGYTHAVVLGMGGSSLAPEVYGLFIEQYGQKKGTGLTLSILDSTSPEQIIEKRNSLPMDKTLFIVSSKSGTTVEVMTLFAYFWQVVAEIEGDKTGRHFIAISDPETHLHKMAVEKGFRRIFEANPNVGGRYSALIAFGIVPAVLAGYDGKKLLEQSTKYSDGKLAEDDKAVELGVVLGAAYHAGRDKLTLLADEKCAPLGSWIEQLIAESSGKHGRGILPVDKEPLQTADAYSNDRIFVYLRADGSLDEKVKNMIAAGQPVYTCAMDDLYDLSAEFYRWEIAAALACAIIDVNAFDQPNVQESKDIAKQMINALKNGKSIDTGKAVFSDGRVSIFSKKKENEAFSTSQACMEDYLSQGRKGDFIAINAFIARNTENEKKLQALRAHLIKKISLPVTLGFGPRFLHSTGQLHKGGKNNGLFIVISQDEEDELDIPGEGISFNGLLFAQALGDTQALEKHQRRVLRIHFPANKFSKTDLTELLS